MSWSYIISVSTLLFSGLAFVYFRFYIKKKTSFDGILKDVRDEVNRLLHSIDEITDRDITLIEDREKQLKVLLEKVDKHLEILNRELDRHNNAEKTYREMGRNFLPGNSVQAPAEKPPAEEPPLEQREVSQAPQEFQIREMARAGIAPAIIASRLGISIAEAEFAAALEVRRT